MVDAIKLEKSYTFSTKNPPFLYSGVTTLIASYHMGADNILEHILPDGMKSFRHIGPLAIAGADILRRYVKQKYLIQKPDSTNLEKVGVVLKYAFIADIASQYIFAHNIPGALFRGIADGIIGLGALEIYESDGVATLKKKVQNAKVKISSRKLRKSLDDSEKEFREHLDESNP